MTTITRELKALHCGQKSFYKKAYVIERYNDETHATESIYLKSYDTIVITCQFENGHIIVSIPNMYSKTTKRHIKDFMIQYFGLQAWAMTEKGYKDGITVWAF